MSIEIILFHKISQAKGTCEISQVLANNAMSEGHSCTDMQITYDIIWIKKTRKNCTPFLSITPSHVAKSEAEFLFNQFLEIQGTHIPVIEGSEYSMLILKKYPIF